MPSANSNNQAYRKALDRAIKLNRQGQWKQAVQSLQRILHQHPNSAAAWGYLAAVYFEHDDMKRAADNFRRATELNPRSEKASLGLFHSLWSLELATEAVAEMRRFLSITESVEYGRLLHDLAVEGRLVPQPPMAHAV